MGLEKGSRHPFDSLDLTKSMGLMFPTFMLAQVISLAQAYRPSKGITYLWCARTRRHHGLGSFLALAGEANALPRFAACFFNGLKQMTEQPTIATRLRRPCCDDGLPGHTFVHFRQIAGTGRAPHQAWQTALQVPMVRKLFESIFVVRANNIRVVCFGSWV